MKYFIKGTQQETPEDEKKEKEGTVGECLFDLVAYNGSLQVAHWKANTITNEHKALGDLYDSMVGLTDTFAEAYMGKYGVVEMIPSCPLMDVTSSPVADGEKIVEDLQEYFKAGEDDDLLNILADMMGTLHKAKYLLKE